MAATKSTRNKLRNARTVIYWMAQIQGACCECGKPLVNGSVSDADDLTVDHLSGDYDHRRMVERKASKGGRLMHKPCHKAKEIRKSKPWLHKKRLALEAVA
jgi:hypothetical protein